MTIALAILAALYPVTVAFCLREHFRSRDADRVERTEREERHAAEREHLTASLLREIEALRAERPALLDRIQAPGAIATALWPQNGAKDVPSDADMDAAYAQEPDSELPWAADLVVGFANINEEVAG